MKNKILGVFVCTLLIVNLLALCLIPINASGQWTATGENGGDAFGNSVSSAGDVNGDGYDDVIVGADDYYGGGKVYVYHGSSTGLSITPSWTAIGDWDFGVSVSSAGDVNNDGYDDVIVGNNRNDDAGQNAGKTYVYHGSSAGLSTTPSWTATGENAFNYFGQSVSYAGDVNDDGYDDVIVGAHNYDSGSWQDVGKTYVYLGSSTGLSITPSWTATGENAYDGFGVSVSSAGDINGDGYDDVIVGAPNYDSGGWLYAGKAYVYCGSSTGLSTTPSWTAEGGKDYDIFGCSVSSAGDINGDGYDDVIVGSPGFEDYGWKSVGRAYVYLGSSTGLSQSLHWYRFGSNEYASFGCSVSSAGDINGDGYDDIVIGEPGNNDYGSNAGIAEVYHGSSTGLSNWRSYAAPSEIVYNGFGVSVSSAGDVNGDGYDDVIVGASFYINGCGKAYAFYGSSHGLPNLAVWTITSETVHDCLGSSVSSAGYVNGDKYADVIVGAPTWEDDFENFPGKAYVYRGSYFGISSTASWTATGENDGDYFGLSVSSAGDINLNGRDDVIVGAYGNDDAGSRAGKAYVYHGSSAGLSTTPSWTATGENVDDFFGYSVSSAGNVDKSGCEDVIVGAYGYQNLAGKAYVYYGDYSGLSTTPSWTATGENAEDLFGCSVSSAGDVNGDGRDDVIVGAYGYQNSAGKAYVYHGDYTGLSTTPSWTITGENSGDGFGYSVSSAGDVNNDGYDDVVIGAPFANQLTGKIYLYLGSSSGLTNKKRAAIGENTGDYFGLSVSSAGDMDDDRYDEFIVGAPNANQLKGKIYIFKFSLLWSMPFIWGTATGEKAWGQFGNSVSSAGNVNKDDIFNPYDDIIIGAPGVDGGKVYGYCGISHGLKSRGLSTTASRTATGETQKDCLDRPASQEISMPRNRAMQTPLLNFLQQHPILYQLLQRFLQI